MIKTKLEQKIAPLISKYPCKNRSNPVVGYDLISTFGVQENGSSLIRNHISITTSENFITVHGYMAKNSTEEEKKLLISLNKKDNFSESHEKFTFYLRRDGILNLTKTFYSKHGYIPYFNIENSEGKDNNDFVLRYENTEDE